MPLVLLNKPFRVLCQFTYDGDRPTLAGYVTRKNVYPAGRLDFDSEGLVVLTDDGALQARISQPRSKLAKIYWAQVEGEPHPEQLRELTEGVRLKDGPARAVSAERIETPKRLWPRTPPIRVRQSVPDAWLRIALTDGRNRQVRRMTAAVGLPTLRLVRAAVGPWNLDGLGPGESRVISNEDAWHAVRRTHTGSGVLRTLR